MPDVAVSRPFGEGDFAQQYRLDPVNGMNFSSAGAVHGRAIQDRLFNGETLKLVREGQGAFHCETRADLACVGQGAVAVVPQIEGAQRPAAALRIVPDDDEFLPLLALRFQPVLVASRRIGRVRALGDDAFQSEVAGFGEHLRSVVRKMLAEP